MILRWELRNHNPLIYDSSYTVSDVNGVTLPNVDNLDDYLKQFELDSNTHINEFIIYTVHEEKITIIFKRAGDYSVDFKIYGQEFQESFWVFYVERFRRSGHAIEKIFRFAADSVYWKHSLKM